MPNTPDQAVNATPHKKAVFRAVDVTKVYRMGNVQVHALRGVTLDLYFDCTIGGYLGSVLESETLVIRKKAAASSGSVAE